MVNFSYVMYSPLLLSNECFRCFLPVILVLTEPSLMLLQHFVHAVRLHSLPLFECMQAPAMMSMRPAPFWKVTQRREGSSVATFRENISVPSSRNKQTACLLKMGPISCSGMSVRNHHPDLRKIQEERSTPVAPDHIT